MKIVQIWSFFWSDFSCIRTEYGPEKTSHLHAFHAVIPSKVLSEFWSPSSTKNLKSSLLSLDFSFPLTDVLELL